MDKEILLFSLIFNLVRGKDCLEILLIFFSSSSFSSPVSSLLFYLPCRLGGKTLTSEI